MGQLLIKNARILDSSQDLDRHGSILVKDGKIEGLIWEHDVIAEDIPVLDAAGLCAAPGFADIHVHLRDPGQTEKEDLFSGTRAAAAGGVTSVVCMPNTKPALDTPEIIRDLLSRASKADARVYPAAAITSGLKGEALTDLEGLKAAGAVAASDDGRPVENAAYMQQALERCYQAGLAVTSHCEDLHIVNGGIINKGKISQSLGVPGIDRTSEDSVTAREIALAAATGTRVHIAHVSTAGSVALIRDAKARGVQVTGETAPHYFLLTEGLLASRDGDYRMNPPLREDADRQAVLEGLLDGTLDAIVTDHAPHTPQEKADFLRCPNGVVGLETSFAASYTALVETGKLTLLDLVGLMSTRPCQIMGLPGGTLNPGALADIVLFSTEESWTVDPQRFQSKARNSAFKGKTFRGRVKYTFLGGRMVYHDI